MAEYHHSLLETKCQPTHLFLLLLLNSTNYWTTRTNQSPHKLLTLQICTSLCWSDALPKEFPHSPLASRTPLHSTLPDYNFTKQKFLTFAKENLEDKYFLLYSHLLTSHFNKSFGFLKALNQKKTDTLPILPIAHILSLSEDRFIFVQWW